MHGAIIREIVKARSSRRHARQAGTGRLILNPVSAAEGGLGAVIVSGGLALQISDTLYKLGLKSVWINVATGLTILVTLACLGLKLVFDDHYVVDGQARSISSRRTFLGIPVSTEVETSFESVQCITVNGWTFGESRVRWGYGISLFTRSGKRLDLLTPTMACSFETAHRICVGLASMLETTVYPEPMAERTLSARLTLNKTWDPAGIAYAPSNAD